MSSKKSNVSIVDGKLILSLPEAETPVVWQMDIDAAKSAAFTVEEDKKQKLFYLTLKADDGKEQKIAPFKEKDGAVAVLMETSSILQNAHGKIKHTAANTNAPVEKQDKGEKMGGVLAVLLIVALLGVWMISASMSRISDTGGVGYQASSEGVSLGTSSESTGVAVSADDFLSNR